MRSRQNDSNNTSSNFNYRKSGGCLNYHEPEVALILTSFASLFYNYVGNVYIWMDNETWEDGNDDIYQINYNGNQLGIINLILAGYDIDHQAVLNIIEDPMVSGVTDAELSRDWLKEIRSKQQDGKKIN